MGVKRLGRAIRTCLLLWAATFAAVMLAQAFWPRPSEVPADLAADVIICLGGGVRDGQLTGGSEGRALRCIDLYDAGVAPTVFFTGAGAAPIMAELAVARGVPRAAIGVEPASRSTLQNALFTRRFLADEAEVIVVSDAYHLPRSWVAFRLMGFKNVTLSAAEGGTIRGRSITRESLAIWFNLGRIALWWATPWLDADVREALLI